MFPVCQVGVPLPDLSCFMVRWCGPSTAAQRAEGAPSLEVPTATNGPCAAWFMGGVPVHDPVVGAGWALIFNVCSNSAILQYHDSGVVEVPSYPTIL